MCNLCENTMIKPLSELNHLSNSRENKSTEMLWSSGERKEEKSKYI